MNIIALFEYFTPIQQRIIHLTAEGLSVGEIARQMGKSEKTIVVHRNLILEIANKYSLLPSAPLPLAKNS